MNITNQATGLLTQIQTRSIPWGNIYSISAAILTAVFIISAVGFAGTEVLHNAAHDVRHGLAFPCH